MSPSLVSTLNEALLCVIRNRVSKRTIAVRTGYKPWFNDLCVLAHLAKHRAYRVYSRSRAQADFEEYGGGSSSCSACVGHSMSGEKHS